MHVRDEEQGEANGKCEERTKRGEDVIAARTHSFCATHHSLLMVCEAQGTSLWEWNRGWERSEIVRVPRIIHVHIEGAELVEIVDQLVGVEPVVGELVLGFVDLE